MTRVSALIFFMKLGIPNAFPESLTIFPFCVVHNIIADLLVLSYTKVDYFLKLLLQRNC